VQAIGSVLSHCQVLSRLEVGLYLGFAIIPEMCSPLLLRFQTDKGRCHTGPSGQMRHVGNWVKGRGIFSSFSWLSEKGKTKEQTALPNIIIIMNNNNNNGIVRIIANNVMISYFYFILRTPPPQDLQGLPHECPLQN
jgi:hypothetical protein